MDGTMDIAPSVQSSHLPAAPFAGHGLQQHHADYWHPSAFLESTHQNQRTPPSFPLSPSLVEIHPQHQQFHPTLKAPEAPAIFPLPIIDPQPYTVEQSATVTSSAVLSPLIQLQLGFINSQQQMYKLHQDFQMQQLKMMEMFLSLHSQQRQQQQEAMAASVVKDHPQQVIPTVALPPTPSEQNVVGSAVVIDQKQSMDQLIITPSTVVLQQQQQQKAQISITSTLAVPTAHGGISENKIEHNKQTTPPSVVLNWFDNGPPRNFQPSTNESSFIKASSAMAAAHDLVRPKFIVHFLDRHGHRLDSPRGLAAASSEVLEWMINQGRGNRRKHRCGITVPVILIADRIVTVRPSSLFLHPKTVAVVNPSTE